jgi:predicted Zn-dependent protease
MPAAASGTRPRLGAARAALTCLVWTCIAGGLLACRGAAITAHLPAGRAGNMRPTAARSLPSPYAYEWFIRAELLRARGDEPAAIEAYRRSLASADPDPYVLARLAEALDRAGQPSAAQRALQAGLELDPRSEAIWLARGDIARRHRDWPAALAAYESAESFAPGSAASALALADLLRAHGHPERAVAVLERQAKRDGGTSAAALRARLELALARGDAERVTQAATAWLEGIAPDFALFRRMAQHLLDSQRPALAARLLAALPGSDADAELRLRSALLLGRRDDAESLLVTHAPSVFGGGLEVAHSYLQIGRPQGALGALTAELRQDDPSRYDLLHARAMIELGEPARAALQLARIPARSPQHQAALQALVEAIAAGGMPTLAAELSRELEVEPADGSAPAAPPAPARRPAQ